MNYLSWTAALCLVLSFSACQHTPKQGLVHEHPESREHIHSHKTEEEHEHNAAHEHQHQHEAVREHEHIEQNDNIIHFCEEERLKSQVEIQKVESEYLGRILRSTAQILPAQNDECIVNAQSDGIVVFDKPDFIVGQSVSAGQTLFSIESNGMIDNNIHVRYQEAEAEYQRAKKEYERKEKLAGNNIVSQSELLRAETEFKQSKSVYDNLRQHFSNGKQVFGSPVNGFIKDIAVRNGDYVNAGQYLFSVSQNKTLLIKAELPYRHYPLLKSIYSANVRIPQTGAFYSLEELNGKLISYGRSLDNNPLVSVFFQIENTAGLLSGSFVDLYIKTKSEQKVLSVPNESITEEMGNYFVFVRIAAESYEKRLVEKGESDGSRTEIRQGLSLGEEVVGKGAILVKLAQSSGALDAHSGHVH